MLSRTNQRKFYQFNRVRACVVGFQQDLCKYFTCLNRILVILFSMLYVISFSLCDLLYIRIYLSLSPSLHSSFIFALCVRMKKTESKLKRSERHTPLICRWKASSVLFSCCCFASVPSSVGKVMNSIYSTWSKNLAWATTSMIFLVWRKPPMWARLRKHTGRSNTFIDSTDCYRPFLPGNSRWSGIRINPTTSMPERSFGKWLPFTRSWKTNNAVLDTIVFWSKVCRDGINRCSTFAERRNSASGK